MPSNSTVEVPPSTRVATSRVKVKAISNICIVFVFWNAGGDMDIGAGGRQQGRCHSIQLINIYEQTKNQPSRRDILNVIIIII